jgi:hypothetical protein
MTSLSEGYSDRQNTQLFIPFDLHQIANQIRVSNDSAEANSFDR